MRILVSGDVIDGLLSNQTLETEGARVLLGSLYRGHWIEYRLRSAEIFRGRRPKMRRLDTPKRAKGCAQVDRMDITRCPSCVGLA
jgi:hypothetical protein